MALNNNPTQQQVVTEVKSLRSDLGNKLVASNIKAGSNVTVSTSGNDVTINATGGSAGVTSVNGKTGVVSLTANDLVRIKIKAYSGGSSTYWYYPIATLPVDNTNNDASCIITGRIGGWVKSNMSMCNAIVSNRDGETGSIIDLGVSSPSAYGLCDIVLYRQTNNTTIVYLKCSNYFSFDINLNLSGATYSYTGNYTTTPSGTLIWSASSSANRFDLYGGNAYVNGVKVLTTINEWYGTQSQYDAIATKSDTTTYYIYEE